MFNYTRQLAARATSIERCSYLEEPNLVRLLTEALTADVETILADQTSLVGADTAIEHEIVSTILSFRCCSILLVHPSCCSMAFPFVEPKFNFHSPLAGALAVLARARKPNGFVRHVGDM
jgi:hypothetical protein